MRWSFRALTIFPALLPGAGLARADTAVSNSVVAALINSLNSHDVPRLLNLFTKTGW